jgi:hypothetical protein
MGVRRRVVSRAADPIGIGRKMVIVDEGIPYEILRTESGHFVGRGNWGGRTVWTKHFYESPRAVQADHFSVDFFDFEGECGFPTLGPGGGHFDGEGY